MVDFCGGVSGGGGVLVESARVRFVVRSPWGVFIIESPRGCSLWEGVCGVSEGGFCRSLAGGNGFIIVGDNNASLENVSWCITIFNHNMTCAQSMQIFLNHGVHRYVIAATWQSLSL